MAIALDVRLAATIRRRLLAWYDRHRRDLPWRRTRDAYRVWLSEMMLQQTQVATVIPYYRRFVRRFPTVRALAAADLDEVLRLWAGLGYYARARNLHRAARQIVTEHAGRVPADVPTLLGLPGVGRYSAGAVASIAHGARAAAVDGNVARVLARLFHVHGDVSSGPGRERVWRLAERLLPAARCGDFNQALMELGATVCLPAAAARCRACPLRGVCRARAAGTVTRIPPPKRRTAVKTQTHVIAAIERDGRWLFVRRPSGGLWGGLWEMPTAELNGRSTAATASRIARGLGCNGVRVQRRPFCEYDHLLTHRVIRFVGHVCFAAGLRADGGEARWSDSAAFRTLGVSGAVRRALAALPSAERST